MTKSNEECQIINQKTLDDFLEDVLLGLRSKPKKLSPKYFYDEAGSELFAKICSLEEYYPTRTEIRILREHSREIAAAIGAGRILIEYGAGSLEKVRILLDALSSLVAFVPVDISHSYLMSSADNLRQSYPDLLIQPVIGDFSQNFDLPKLPSSDDRHIAFFPGSTIGNFDPYPAKDFLTSIANTVGPGGGLLIGVDLQKDVSKLISAYDDSAGITAQFNKNILMRINRELGGDFNLELFSHKVRYDAQSARIEMHLRSLTAQDVNVAGQNFHFTKGETIHTENCYKYTLDSFDAIAENAHFKRHGEWLDHKELFAVLYYVCEN